MTEAVDDAVYREDARSYRSIGWSLLVIPVAFGLDLLVSGRHGALVHLPGWLLFGALLVGMHWLVLHAVRSTHSLHVTSDEVVVGDEAVPRADITGVTSGRAADPDLATLGWPNGFPRGAKAITARLSDGRDVLVPTRFPGRLLDALQVGAPEPEQPAAVRVAGEADLAEVPSIGERAEAIFRVAGHPPPSAPTSDLTTALVVLVLGEPAVGFARIDELDGSAHLRHLAVLPSAMRRGFGSRLLEAACDWARGQGYPAITLTTFADVPWNAPFFAARGFAPVEHRASDGSGQVVMRRALPPGALPTGD